MLTREQLRTKILNADDRVRELVKVPEWDVEVYVSVMSGTARDAWEASLLSNGKPDFTDVRAKLAAVTITDEKGDAVFSAGDIAKLSRRNSVALDRIVSVARRLNKLGAEGLEEAKGN